MKRSRLFSGCIDMSIVSICIICIVTSIITRSLGKESPAISSLLSIAAAAAAGAAVLYTMTDVIENAKRIYDSLPLNKQYFEIMVKGAGICIITKTSADCCRDCGESALASSAETAGRISLLMISMPLFNGVLGIIEELIK